MLPPQAGFVPDYGRRGLEQRAASPLPGMQNWTPKGFSERAGFEERQLGPSWRCQPNSRGFDKSDRDREDDWSPPEEPFSGRLMSPTTQFPLCVSIGGHQVVVTGGTKPEMGHLRCLIYLEPLSLFA